MEEVKRTFLEWNREQRDKGDWYVLDPDGFDRRASDFYERQYTWEEFYERSMGSTLMVPYGLEGENLG